VPESGEQQIREAAVIPGQKTALLFVGAVTVLRLPS
jgi:hypothetical protein